MAFSLTKFVKGLRIFQEGTLTPRAIEMIPGGSASTTQTLVSSQTTDKTLTFPDATDTLVGKNTTDTLTNKTLTAPVINSPTGIVKADVGLGNVDNTSDATKNSATATLTNKTIVASPTGTNVISNLADSSIDAAAAIALSKLAALSTAKALQSNASTGIIEASSVTNTELGYVSGVTSAIQTQINAKADSSTAVTLNGIQTLTNKTLTAPVINSPTGITKSDVGLSNVDNTSDATKNAASVTLTNKTIDNTNTIAVKDTLFTIQDDGDTSKQVKFQASGVTTATTRTLTIPDASTTIVGTDATQTLTNKTVTSPTITTPIIDVISFTDQGSTPASPSAGTHKVYVKTDGKGYIVDSTGAETQLGSSAGVVNYITNPNAATNTIGWATYADAAGALPVDGTGGSPASTLTRDAVLGLRGSTSFKWTKSAANRQGEGFSYDFQIDRCDEGKVLQASFAYSVSSGALSYADDDMTVWIYDILNSTLIPVTPYKIKNQTLISDRFFFEFQTGVGGAVNYRLIVHTASTSAVAYTLNFGDFQLGPYAKLYGAAATAPITWTPTISSFGAVSNINFNYYQVGNFLHGQGTFTAGTVAGTLASFSLPSGLSIDNTSPTGILINNTTSNPGQIIGTFGSVGASTQAYVVTATGTSTSLIYIGSSFSAGGASLTPGNASSTTNNNQVVSLEFKVPILGWAASQLLSQDASTRVVAARFNTSAQSIGAAATTLIFTSVDWDTHGAYSTSTGLYTCPVPGKYKVTSTVLGNSVAQTIGTTAAEISVSKNGGGGSIIAEQYAAASATYRGAVNGSGNFDCKAGDTLAIKFKQGGTDTLDQGSAIWGSVELISGPAQILASDSINARYYASATAISGSLTTINWTTKDFDTNGAMSAGTYTVPIAGKYMVISALSVDGTYGVNNQAQLVIQKNGTTTSRARTISAAANSSEDVKIMDVINCLAGDTLRIQALSDATSPTIASSNVANYITIVRMGQ